MVDRCMYTLIKPRIATAGINKPTIQFVSYVAREVSKDQTQLYSVFSHYTTPKLPRSSQYSARKNALYWTL